MKLKSIFIILVLFLCTYIFADIVELFFSEYIEGSSYNKALEIFNGTGVTVDLTNYQLWQVANGGNWYEYTIDFPSGATIADGDVYVVCHEEADPIILAAADLVVTLYHNGNDAQGLAKDDGTGTFYLIDTIGEEGPDPGEGWAVAGVNNATKDHTLVRKSTVEAPTTDWALSAGTNASDSQWEVYDQNTFDYIGFHDAGADIIPPILTSATALSSTSVEIVFNEPLEETTAENINNYSIEPLLAISSATLQSNKVVLTTAEQTAAENYTITVNNVEDLAGNPIEAGSTINFTGYSGTQYDLIADIQADPASYEGQSVNIWGIVTIGVNVIQTGNTNAYVQDNSGSGINIYDSSVINELVRGNEVEITGEVTDYIDAYGNTTTEITNPSVTVLSTGNPEPAPLIISLDDASNIELEGTLLQATGIIYEIYLAGGGTNLNIRDNDNNELTVRVWDTCGLDLSEFVEGFILQAIGIGDEYSNKLQVVPGYQDQLSEGTMGGYEDVIIDPLHPDPGEDVSIILPFPDPVDNVLLYWKTASDVNFEPIEMDSISVRTDYQATIPGQKQGTTVYFYIVVTDTSGLAIYFPPDYPYEPPYDYQYSVTSHRAILNIPAKPFNPYAGETFPIEFASQRGDKAILRIYNAEGKLAFTPQNIIISNSGGITRYDWDGRDKNNNLLPLGLYICYLEVINADTGRKKTAKAPIVIGASLK